MTNVKLKLMFYLLNALLTDIIHAKPYSETNTTDLEIKYNSSNNTYIPVDSNSDTLTVASDDQTPEETNKNANTQMEAILNAEQNRDEAFSKKVIKDQKSVLEMTKNDAAAIEQQLNTSSSLLEDIIDSETDREETLTDILFRPDAEFAEESPRFEFLIAAKVNFSDTFNKTADMSDGKNDNSLDIIVRNMSDLLKKAEYVELVEVLKPGENKSAYTVLNMTSHEVDNDLAPDTSFSDTQTLFLACFATLLPLLGVLLAFFFIRCMCRRWCPHLCGKKTHSSLSDSSEKQDLNSQLKSPLKDAIAVNESLDSDAVPANGSIFTMTLKNNHLIVETEERNDFTKNGRETKMKYSPDSDGIFVVEVQQSNAYRPHNIALQSTPPRDPEIPTNQALIHRVDEELERKNTEEETKRNNDNFKRNRSLALSSTGLSISDLSMSSVGSQNVSYSYSGQVGYELGPFGYPVYTGYDISNEEVVNGIVHDNSQEPLIMKTPTDPDRPVVTAAIFKQDSIIGNDTKQGPGYCMEGSSDGPLLSDVQAREFRLQHINGDDNKVENGVAVLVTEKIESPKNTLNRADSLPVRLEDEKLPNQVENVMETIAEDEVPKEVYLKGKRASLPIIRTDMYESVKDVMRPVGSPKFEVFDNEVSRSVDVEVPLMITITEESEPSKSDITS